MGTSPVWKERILVMEQPDSNLEASALQSLGRFPKTNVANEVWRRYRPYLVAITVASLVAATLWVPLFLFEKLIGWMPVPGWAGDFIEQLHALDLVASFLVFSWISFVDILLIQKER
jgi:hypothetical protein